MGERRGTKALELWCRRVTEGYSGVRVDNMTTSWRDGLAFCALIHHFRPDLIDFSSLKKEDVYHNNELAFRTAESYLGIPALLDAEDMAQYAVPDRLSILTYLSQYYQYFASVSSPSRLIAKRPSSSKERDSMPESPSLASPPTKMMSGGLARRDPCTACGLPVFLAQRLLVERRLYHRTCFCCARCGAQLTLAGFYQTETDGQYCCETCPDEESDTEQDSTDYPAKVDDDVAKKIIREKTLSDEEKSYNLQSLQRSNIMESNVIDDKKIEPKWESSSAFAGFMTSHLAQKDSDDDDVLPALPTSLPPSKTVDLPQLVEVYLTESNLQSPSVEVSKEPEISSDISDNDKSRELSNENSNICVSDASAFVDDVFKEIVSEETAHPVVVNSIHANQLETASVSTVEDDVNISNESVDKAVDAIAKDNSDRFDAEGEKSRDSPADTSLVKMRMKIFETMEKDSNRKAQPNTIVKKSNDDNINIDKFKVVLDDSSKSIDSTSVSITCDPVKREHDGETQSSISLDLTAAVTETSTEVNESRDSEFEKVPCTDDSAIVSFDDDLNSTKSQNVNDNDVLTNILDDTDTRMITEDSTHDDNTQSNIISIDSSDDIIEVKNVEEKRISIINVEEESISVKDVEEKRISIINVEEESISEKDVEEKRISIINVEEESISVKDVEEKRISIINVEEESISVKDVEEKCISIINVEEESISVKDVEEECISVKDEDVSFINDVSKLDELNTEIIPSDDSNVNRVELEVSSPKSDVEIVVDDDSKIENKVESVEAEENQSKENYPVHLNPFSDDESETDDVAMTSDSMSSKRTSNSSKKEENKNPFESSSDDEQNQIIPVKKKSSEKPPRPPPPVFLLNANKANKSSKESRRVVTAPTISLNPFSSDEDENSEDEKVSTRAPIPKPRQRIGEENESMSMSHLGIEPRSFHGSSTSLTSTISRRKKAPAPKPPGLSDAPQPAPRKCSVQENVEDLNDSSMLSQLSSPNSSLSHMSPQVSPRSRKRRPAPLPPSSGLHPFANSTFLKSESNLNSLDSTSFCPSPILQDDKSLMSLKRVVSAAEFDNDPDLSIATVWENEKSEDKSKDQDSSIISDASLPTFHNKSTSGQWKRRKGPAPAIPLLQRRNPGPPMPPAVLRRELQMLEAQQRGLEKQGVRLEEIIRERCESKEANENVNMEPDPETDELVLQLFELVNEKNELFRRQSELMYIRRQQRLEEEHADLEHQIRLLMARPEANKTDTDKTKEEQLIQRLVEVVERRNEVITSLEMDRLREKEEDKTIRERMASHRAKREENSSISSLELQNTLKPEKKKDKRRWLKKDKTKKGDADKISLEDSEVIIKKEKKHKKWF
ncbi:MICAL-like protein isoform X2 [Arctopsyche grandis]